jgi:malonyl-CoA/methylmalonyl-CoA synthetase
MNLCDLFAESLIRRGDVLGLECGDKQYKFGELEAESNRLASLFRQKRLERGDRVCVCLGNSFETVALFVACIKAGLIFVPLDPSYRNREISGILSSTDPKAVIADRPIQTGGGGASWLSGALLQEAQACGVTRLAVTAAADDVAAILFTSGTTGAMKGAKLTHGNLAANALNLIGSCEIDAEDRFLLALPLSHAHGFAHGLHCWLGTGCRLRLLERFDRRTVARSFLDFRATLFFGVPAMYAGLLTLDAAMAQKIGAQMRLFVSGSAPLQPHVFEAFDSLFGHRILERYGTTETLACISNLYRGDRVSGTVGLPLPGVTIRLLDRYLNEAPDGAVGEVFVSGATVFAGYWGREKGEEFAGSYFRTGDLARKSADGRYSICGRTTDLIISGGLNIYPREIEEVLEEQPGVVEAAVVGAPEAYCGEVPVAYVVANGPIDASMLIEACRENLAAYKVPNEILFVDVLPRNRLGKLERHLLKPPEAADA